jgi:heme/copper-type cytochrome/quinol oxidase subunit 2
MASRKAVGYAALALGAFALLMALLSVLALLDISQSLEPSLVLEWVIVWAALVVIVVAQIVSIVAVVALLSRRSSKTAAETGEAQSG